MAYQSLENLLTVQTQKLQDLETATDLIQSKSFIQEELVTAYGEVCSIARDIQDLKEDVKIMRVDNDRCKDLLNMLKSLDNQIRHMEQNIPLKIQEYVKSEIPTNNNTDDNSSKPKEKNGNASFNNTTFNNATFNGSDAQNANNTINTTATTAIKNCKKTLFNEPEIPQMISITPSEFSKLPKYIIGRHTIDTLNSLVSSINQIIKSKYSLIALGKNGSRKKGELDLYLHYKKEQMNLGPDEENTYFFTAEDYEKYIKARLDKTKLNLLIALRHCKKLREIRTTKTVNYALILPN
ncbi:hypothetical protein TKK_0008350 [Trichogramma kaykai]|uniref:SKA complex subunit 1 n=1 Tax=Trichogramma kaykai TaxID=54128 RepID=A0ABD2X5C3_9HYME